MQLHINVLAFYIGFRWGFHYNFENKSFVINLYCIFIVRQEKPRTLPNMRSRNSLAIHGTSKDMKLMGYNNDRNANIHNK